MTPVAREDELRVLARFARSTSWPRSLLLTGPAGIGKSTLTRALAGELEAAGCTVVLLTVPEPLSEVPGSGLLALRDALTAAGAETGRLDVLRADPDVPRVLVASALVAALTAMPAPVVLAIDDAHWLDGQSRVVVAALLRRLSGRVAVVVATREHSWYHADGVLVVGHLDDDAMARVVRQRHTGLAPDTVEAIVTLADGVPFHAVELGRHAARSPGTALPDSLLQSHRLWVEALSPAAHRVLATAALATDPTVAAVATAEGLTETSLVDLLHTSLVRGVVTVDEAVGFVHPLHREALLTLTPVRWIERSHGLLALHTEGATRARHWALSARGDDASITAELITQAEALLEHGAVLDAQEWSGLALRAAPPGTDEHAAAARVSGVAQLARGRTDGIAELLSELDARPLSTSARVHRDLLAFRLDYAERFTQSAGTLRELISRVTEPRLSTELALWHAHVAASAFDYDTMSAEAARGLALATSLDDSQLLAQARAVSAIVRQYLGHGLDAPALEAAMADVDPTRVPPPPLDPHFIACCAFVLAGDHRRAREVGQVVVERFLDHHLVSYGGLTLLPVLVAARSGGRTLETVAVLEDVRRHADPGGVGGDWLTQVLTLGQRLGRVDEDDRLEDEIRCLHEALAEHGPLRAVSMALAADAIVDGYLARGDAQRAHAFGADFATMLPGMPIGEPGLVAVVPLHAEACVALGRLEEADTTISWLLSLPLIAERPQVLGPTLRARAQRALAVGDLPLASSYGAQADVVARESGLVGDEARAALLLGDVERRARRPARARDHLLRAAELFTATGQEVWASRAREGLGRLPTSRLTGQAGALTAQERLVAELAAAGHRNTDIADEMHLSVKTVEGYLSSTYRKLGIRRRAELSRALDARLTPSPRP